MQTEAGSLQECLSLSFLSSIKPIILFAFNEHARARTHVYLNPKKEIMFSPVSVSLSVCLSDRLRKNL